MSFDIQAIRAAFPLLQQTAHGKPLVYLDSAATSQKPQAVLDALLGHYTHNNANIHRAVYDLAARATHAYEQARGTVQRFLGAEKLSEIIFTRGATEAINLIAECFARPRLKPGDEVLITAMEHHANIVPWQLVCQATGAKLVVAPINDDGDLIWTEFKALINPRTQMIAVPQISNSLGTVNPIEDICIIAKNKGIPILVDGAQAVQHVPVDVQALGCDFYVFSGHKIYGPTGIGALYGKAEHLEVMPPYQAGGDMIRDVSFEGTTYAEPPARFEAGTPHIAGAVGLAAALDWLTALGLDAVAAHEDTVTTLIADALAEMPKVTLIGRPKKRASVVSFTVDGLHPSDVGTLLDRHGIAIRTGHHCTQPLMARMGVVGTARASVGVYNTVEDAQVFVAALTRVISRFA